MKNLLAASLLAASTMLAAPAAAQDEAGDKVNMVIIYGDDACPESTEDVINVCARKAEGERYRIPENLRESDSGENVAWAERVESFETVGAFGTLSCSPAGAGGVTGCTQEMINAAYGEKGESKNIRFGQLIEEARAERLAEIDSDAAEEQQRVEQIEREYLERLEKERDAPLPGDEGNAADAEPLPDPNATPEG
ncbi:hypothetical protein [Pontixanthobacter sp. CEM42]|uniref:hypothetical protein n=1 Tax=Pontixanthobacter sp. CEM42 TaxID=2792077 RepID=UPI001AE05294|nr:hypothetical protein [Pontixanthobacter sp. CEM42]